MFAYSIIGIELIILYFIFWVVFIREPKPREIRAELWGSYEVAESKSEVDKDESIVAPIIASAKEMPVLPSRNRGAYLRTSYYRMTKLHRRAHRHLKRQCSCVCHHTHLLAKNWRGQATRVNTQQLNRQLAETLLLVLNKALNKLSVKIPH